MIVYIHMAKREVERFTGLPDSEFYSGNRDTRQK